MKMRVLGPILVVVALASAACSSGSSESSPSSDRSASAESSGSVGSASLPPIAGIEQEPNQEAVNEALNGLTREQAETAAEAAGYTVRVVREDDESFVMTMDYRTDRINIELDDGRVTRAYVG